MFCDDDDVGGTCGGGGRLVLVVVVFEPAAIEGNTCDGILLIRSKSFLFLIIIEYIILVISYIKHVHTISLSEIHRRNACIGIVIVSDAIGSILFMYL